MENTKIEELLKQMYAQPDLKGGVFNFITPIIQKAEKYLQKKLDVEQKYALENLIYKEIPELVNRYVTMPIAYRNEKLIKDGKTHRQMLINNFELLAQSFNKIENDIYANVDIEASVQTRVLQTKYQMPVLIEADHSYQKVEDDFQWSEVKEQYKNFVNQEIMDKVFVKETEKSVPDVKKEEVKKESTENIGEIFGSFLFFMCFIGMILFLLNFIYHIAIDNDRTEELGEIGQIIQLGLKPKSEKDPTTNITKEATLQLVKNYSKENKIIIEQSNDKLIATNKQTKVECKESLKWVNYYRNNLPIVTINGLTFNDLMEHNNLTSSMINSACNLETDNIVSATYNFK